MRKIQNHDLAQLLMQLRFTPEAKRRPQLKAAQELLDSIEPATLYPFDYIFFRITGFNPKSPLHSEPSSGTGLADDLRIFIGKLSGQLAQSVSEQQEKVYDIVELATAMHVSTKTVQRWRRRGLLGLKFIFPDGSKRFGFTQSSVDKFTAANRQLVAGAQVFQRLTAEQKKKIIRQAAALAARTDMSRHQIIEEIAAETGRAHETIRYTLLDYERGSGSRKLVKPARPAVTAAEAGELYKLYGQDVSVKELVRHFGRSKSSIYRIINQKRAKLLHSLKIEYIASHEFLDEKARETILGPTADGVTSRQVNPAEEPAGDGAVTIAPTLTREREGELFRRYNYLKFLACRKREQLHGAGAASADIERVEEYLRQAEQIKKTIIESNMRLVAAIARRHAPRGRNVQDLVSEGNLSLMRAVEKFDYTRGFRFATYASWAIAKDFARKGPAGKSVLEKATAASLEEVQRDLRIEESSDFGAIEDASKSLVEVIRNELDEREQYVILNHFGLMGALLKKQRKTLGQIGEQLGLTKERVRQIELGALQKLRQSLSIEQFELLTG